jgi:hypothetical protein
MDPSPATPTATPLCSSSSSLVGHAQAGPAKRSALRLVVSALLALAPWPTLAATLLVCRSVDLSAPVLGSLTIPQATLFRDNGRADDPLADITGDRWQLRLETLTSVVIPSLAPCARVLVRITSDSSVKYVSANEGRRFVYAGSANLLDGTVTSEELLTVQGRVLDSVP